MILGGEKLDSKSVTDQVAEYLISHVSNSSIEKPIIKINEIFGVDMSITKHVLMLWIVSILVSLSVIIPVRKYLRQSTYNPSKTSSAIEAIVQFIRDSIVLPNVGPNWVNTWTPLVLTFFFFMRVAWQICWDTHAAAASAVVSIL